MSKISLIIQREYLTRVKKRSFIILTFLGPLLMASIWIVPIYLSSLSNEVKVISVLDETGVFFDKFEGDENMQFVQAIPQLKTAKENLNKLGNYALLYIPKPDLHVPNTAILYSKKQSSLDVKSYIKGIMKKEIEAQKLALHGIDPETLLSIKTNVFISSIKVDSSGNEEKTSTEISMAVGMFSSILIYFFIFLFGAQVMRGVIEEKTSRIIEVVISSVKPFQLMMGKILGIALVGFTQFMLWVVLTATLVFGFQFAYQDELKAFQKSQIVENGQGLFPNEPVETEIAETQAQDENIGFFIDALLAIDYAVILGSFLFYFLGGYLLYAALFAAVGSAVDSEADTHQFMMPITIPLILSIIMAQLIITDPNGPIAFWMSMFPLTSPIIMMIRIPFGVPYWEILTSGILLIFGFIFTTWVAAKIYRTGILMYGKKVNYKELWKWLFYKA
ncbi:MAG: ABC transporter permease [Bacteroidales bacterium]|jgi:ABC-2 type transport system permease protein|nr:ABC transporter permease [Bacteroidales bacterium]